MANNVNSIKTLRDSTGLPLGDIKKALDQADGDEHKALEILNAQGARAADKKSSRSVKEGVVSSYIHSNKKLGSMVELLCETDFVARNAEFQALAYDLAMHIAASHPGQVSDLLEQPFVKDPQITIKDLINRYIVKLGENIQIGRFKIFQI